MIAAVTVNFKREAFFLPVLDIPVYWYGVLFALGYFLSSLLFSRLIYNHLRKNDLRAVDKNLKKQADSLTQSISFYLLMGLVVGARVGHVAFYEGFDKLLDLKFLLNIRDGGLASHGATVCILVAFFFWIKQKKKLIASYKLNFRMILDFVTMASLVNAVFIRLGNFINQEILGTVTDRPWAVIFLDPLSGLAPMPRHPVQLYEALFYAALLGVLYFGYTLTDWFKRRGVMTGWFFITLFSFRFIVEGFKEKQSIYDGNVLMGQILSLPLIVFGVIYLFYACKGAKVKTDSPVSQSPNS